MRVDGFWPVTGSPEGQNRVNSRSNRSVKLNCIILRPAWRTHHSLGGLGSSRQGLSSGTLHATFSSFMAYIWVQRSIGASGVAASSSDVPVPPAAGLSVVEAILVEDGPSMGAFLHRVQGGGQQKGAPARFLSRHRAFLPPSSPPPWYFRTIRDEEDWNRFPSSRQPLVVDGLFLHLPSGVVALRSNSMAVSTPGGSTTNASGTTRINRPWCQYDVDDGSQGGECLKTMPTQLENAIEPAPGCGAAGHGGTPRSSYRLPSDRFTPLRLFLWESASRPLPDFSR